MGQLYHAVGAAAALKDCSLSVPNAKGTVEAVLKEDSATSHDVYMALAVAEKLKLKINYNGFSEALTVALAKDDSAARFGFDFGAECNVDSMGSNNRLFINTSTCWLIT